MLKLSSSIAASLLVACWGLANHSQIAFAQESSSTGLVELREHLLFLSTFDGTTSAVVAKGDGRLFTAKDRRSFEEATPGLHDPDVVLAKAQGLVGDALQFKKKKRLVTYYEADGNVGYRSNSWSGAVSFWLSLDPAKDLEPGFCDPIQITDSGYNDAAIWVDFTKENPRDFRLGIIGDIKSWNPEELPPDRNPEFERRLSTVTKPPFATGKWTHVLINFSDLNTKKGKSEFYLDGKLQGTKDVQDPFTCVPSKMRILLGLSYIGLFDELAVFDRPLSKAEVLTVFRATKGLAPVNQ
ncbi:MAG: LamG-like jellyroll fold domain-containing protein [Planctomycetota bacterium]|nr:LamG-like jellyroll fold domain-containing protein [Planctomycetota bacterium]